MFPQQVARLVLPALTTTLMSGMAPANGYKMVPKDHKSREQKSVKPLPPALHYYVPPPPHIEPKMITADACIYGGTASGVIAAVQLAQAGRKVVLLEPSGHLGGMTTGGLSYTDIGNKAAIGGLSRQFYRRMGTHYGAAEEWTFEPHIAKKTLLEMVQEAKANLTVYPYQFLKSVQKSARTSTQSASAKQPTHLTALTTESGLTVQARIFLDTTYEGDLMAKAGVHYTVGREDNHLYQETLNGVQVRQFHQFEHPVDPYVKEGDPSSGLLPTIDSSPLAPEGTGDKRIQAYNFRLCLTDDPSNRIPFIKPRGYDRLQYVLLARYLATGWNQVFNKFDALRNHKYDVNNHGGISTDFIGMNYAFPEADYKTREKIFHAHAVYQMGLFWFLANDPAVPEPIRTRMNRYGLCKDEFTETDGWSFQLYVREARRMVSDYVMTEHNCLGKVAAADSIGLAAYTMDSHNCRRFIEERSEARSGERSILEDKNEELKGEYLHQVKNEGDVQVGGAPPYPISYHAIVPKEEDCDNLLVPICLSASHIAYGSIRMEPVFMILGQSAAIAADIALTQNVPVQRVPYSDLRPRLEQAGQILHWTPPVPKAKGTGR